MCGIAGYSLGARSGVDRTLAAQSLFASIAERGSDAVGYAYRRDGAIVVHKQRTGASELLDTIAIPDDATQALLHVRDYTKGHPSLAANNHPIRHGGVVGIHNGVVANDDEIFERHALARAEPGMTVDSEAIFALVDKVHDTPRAALEELYGSVATAWVDERRPESVHVARGVGRPLWIGEGGEETLFASTREALELVERYAGVRLEKREVEEGTVIRLEEGHVAETSLFEPDRSFDEEPLPGVRAPDERISCLERLAWLAQRRHGAFGAAAAAR